MREAARRAAQRYAPTPADSRLTYALLGASLAFIALVSANGFYQFDPVAHPAIAIAMIASGAVAALAWRIVLLKRHRVAHQAEYDKASALV